MYNSIKQAVRVATQYAPAPACLTIISCKYEKPSKPHNKKKISTVLFYQVCADTVKAKQSTAEYGPGYAFLPIKQVDL